MSSIVIVRQDEKCDGSSSDGVNCVLVDLKEA